MSSGLKRSIFGYSLCDPCLSEGGGGGGGGSVPDPLTLGTITATTLLEAKDDFKTKRVRMTDTAVNEIDMGFSTIWQSSTLGLTLEAKKLQSTLEHYKTETTQELVASTIEMGKPGTPGIQVTSDDIDVKGKYTRIGEPWLIHAENKSQNQSVGVSDFRGTAISAASEFPIGPQPDTALTVESKLSVIQGNFDIESNVTGIASATAIPIGTTPGSLIGYVFAPTSDQSIFSFGANASWLPNPSDTINWGIFDNTGLLLYAGKLDTKNYDSGSNAYYQLLSRQVLLQSGLNYTLCVVTIYGECIVASGAVGNRCTLYGAVGTLDSTGFVMPTTSLPAYNIPAIGVGTQTVKKPLETKAGSVYLNKIKYPETLSDGQVLTYNSGEIKGASTTALFPLLAPDGSESVPSYSFVDGPGEGIYRAVNSVCVASEGKQVLDIDNNICNIYSSNLRPSRVWMPLGTAAEPSIYFDGPAKCGIYSIDASAPEDSETVICAQEQDVAAFSQYRVDILPVKTFAVETNSMEFKGSQFTTDVSLAEIKSSSQTILNAPAIQFLSGSATYTFPNSNGSSGQVLTTNGAGALSWSTPSTSLVGASRGRWACTLTTPLTGGTDAIPFNAQFFAPIGITKSGDSKTFTIATPGTYLIQLRLIFTLPMLGQFFTVSMMGQTSTSILTKGEQGTIDDSGYCSFIGTALYAPTSINSTVQVFVTSGSGAEVPNGAGVGQKQTETWDEEEVAEDADVPVSNMTKKLLKGAKAPKGPKAKTAKKATKALNKPKTINPKTIKPKTIKPKQIKTKQIKTKKTKASKRRKDKDEPEPEKQESKQAPKQESKSQSNNKDNIVLETAEEADLQKKQRKGNLKQSFFEWLAA